MSLIACVLQELCPFHLGVEFICITYYTKLLLLYNITIFHLHIYSIYNDFTCLISYITFCVHFSNFITLTIGLSILLRFSNKNLLILPIFSIFFYFLFY